MMKSRLYFFVVLFVLALITQAQNSSLAILPTAKSTFGIFGGINFQNINGKDAGGNDLSNSLVTRFNIGINVEIPIAPEFYIQPGLQFITKGTKGIMPYTNNNQTYAITREVKLNYLEVPINLVFKPLLGSGHLILGFGPYVGYCLGGTAKFSGSNAPQNADIKFESSVPTNAENNLLYFNRMDIGANFLVGYEFKNGINLLLNTQLGLININSTTTTKMTNKNTGFGLTLGYRI